MRITAAQIAPLLTGTYTDQAAVGHVLKTMIVPLFSDKLRALAPRGTSREDFVHDVLSDFTLRVIEKAGITGPKPPPPDDFTAWLRTVLSNAARDLRRRLTREPKTVTLDEHQATAILDREAQVFDTDAPDVTPDARRARLDELARHSPLYVIGLYCWNDPSLIDRPLLESAAALPNRGRSSTGAGLMRSVDATWHLLREHHRELVAGADRNRPVCERLAWIFRSESLDFVTWQASRRAVKSACETLYSWNKRARRYLEQGRARHIGEDD